MSEITEDCIPGIIEAGRAGAALSEPEKAAWVGYELGWRDGRNDSAAAHPAQHQDARERLEAEALERAGYRRQMDITQALTGPHEWGYRDPVEGSFINDNVPFAAAEFIAHLRARAEAAEAKLAGVVEAAQFAVRELDAMVCKQDEFHSVYPDPDYVAERLRAALASTPAPTGEGTQWFRENTTVYTLRETDEWRKGEVVLENDWTIRVSSRRHHEENDAMAERLRTLLSAALGSPER